LPIYEYICHDCGHEFEKIVGWSDDSPACASCGSQNVSRQLSPPAIHFKGSGWYITDSKNGKKGKNGANGVSGANGSAKESDNSSDEKATAEKSSSPSKDNGASSSSESKSESSTKKESAKASS